MHFSSFTFFSLGLHSGVPHLDQTVPETIAQHCALHSHSLQRFLEHHQQHLISSRWHHEICADM